MIWQYMDYNETLKYLNTLTICYECQRRTIFYKVQKGLDFSFKLSEEWSSNLETSSSGPCPKIAHITVMTDPI